MGPMGFPPQGGLYNTPAGRARDLQQQGMFPQQGFPRQGLPPMQGFRGGFEQGGMGGFLNSVPYKMSSNAEWRRKLREDLPPQGRGMQQQSGGRQQQGPEGGGGTFMAQGFGAAFAPAFRGDQPGLPQQQQQVPYKVATNAEWRRNNRPQQQQQGGGGNAAAAAAARNVGGGGLQRGGPGQQGQQGQQGGLRSAHPEASQWQGAAKKGGYPHQFLYGQQRQGYVSNPIMQRQQQQEEVMMGRY